MLNAIRHRRRWQLGGLIFPGALWMILFFNLPLLIVLFISLVERGRAGGIRTPVAFTLDSYKLFFNSCVSAFASPDCNPFLYLNIFANSLRIALIVTALCILVGYPLSYFISQRNPRWRDGLLLLVMIPFWTNFLVRTYAL